MVMRHQHIKISEERINELFDKYQNQSLKSTMLYSITEVMDDNNNLPSSFDLSYSLDFPWVYDLIKNVLSDLGIAPIQVRAIFKKERYLYHVQLAL